MDRVDCTRISHALARKPAPSSTTADFLNGCHKLSRRLARYHLAIALFQSPLSERSVTVSVSLCDTQHSLASDDSFCFKLRLGQRVLPCLSRKVVPSTRTTSFSSFGRVVRLVGTLCFSDNFRTHYGAFNVSCPKTVEHRSAPNFASLRQDMLSFSAILCF